MISTQRRIQYISLFVTVLLLVSADYVAKALVQANLSPGESIPLLTNALRLTYVQNTSGLSWFVPVLPTWVQIGYQIFLFLLAIVSVPIYLFYTQKRRHTCWSNITFVGLVSSFLGHSLVDLFFPYTVDFLQVFRSPSANFADVYSYAGIGALLIEIAQVRSVQKPRWKGLRQHLVDEAKIQKEFFDFLRKGLK
jgi:lipoprotein signal peptidase